MLDQRHGLFEVEGKRLLAEDRDAPVNCHPHQAGMSVRGCGDDCCVGKGDCRAGVRDSTAEASSGIFRPCWIRVGDNEFVDAAVASEKPPMQHADPARPQQRDAHVYPPE